MSDLLLDSVSFSYGETPVLENCSLSLKEAELVCLVGLSGSGKSTLLKLVAGLLDPTKGKRRDISASYMMQEGYLLPWRTVIQNILLPFELGKGAKIEKAHLERAKGLLAEFDLVGTENLYPSELSGGMRQRVALARALLPMRPVVLLDEPFGSLDVILREQIYVYLREVQRREKISVLMVSHDFRDALSLADRILFLAEGGIQREWHSRDLNILPEIKEAHRLAAISQRHPIFSD